MSDPTGSAPDDSGGRDGPIRLQNAQRRIRDAYFDHDAGLFVLNCNPGVGKTVTVVDVGAEELLRRYVDGDPTPEQHVCVISFARDDAASFVPEIIARLRDLVEHDMTPAAKTVSEAELEYLVRRVRRAPFIGTIDSLFRSLLGEFVNDVGFDAMPAVGNDGQLDRLHADCYEAVAAKPANATAIDVVETAYPVEDDYDDGPAGLLRQAHHQCRTRRLSTADFRAELHDTVDAVYAEGETTSVSDVADALARCVGTDAATQVCADLDEADRDALVSADQQLHAAWRETIDAFCTLLEAYREEYATRIRDRGVISHTDCAFLVAEFLTGRLDTADAKRDRVLARYRGRIESVIIDEAQDVAELQHAGLAPLITADCRVLTAGDLRQSIYGFRDAHPSIFQQAAEDGLYFSIDWDTHVTETAATTYRCTPDVAGAINAIAEPALTDATRGNLGELDVTFPPLDAARDPVAEPNVHIAAFDTAANPGTKEYVAPDGGKGEAGILATYIAAGLADGTLTAAGASTDGNRGGESDTVDSQPDVTVLFRWRTQMARYADAFETEGLTVANASDYLFESPVVRTVFDVAAWLTDPADPERMRALVADSSLQLASLKDAFNACDWRLDAVREDATGSIDVTDKQRDVLARLHQLREMRATFRAQSAATSIADIIEGLGLRADPEGLFPAVTPEQRVANLDALVHLVTQWELDSVADLDDVVDILAPVQADPQVGPMQPVTGADDHDIVFKTIHQAKGSESDVVALADLGWSLRKLGPTSQRFVATGPTIGLAPPVNAAAPSIDSLAVFTRGLYDPSNDSSRFGRTSFPGDIGLRWASERWTDPNTTDQSAADLAGHDRVQSATRRTHSESFRMLYVALTRAEQHLVVPLPREVHGTARPRDRWLETVRDGLGFDGTPGSGIYTLDVEPSDGTTREIDIAVNDVGTSTKRSAGEPSANTEPPFTAIKSPDRNDLPPLVPRFLRPSTLYPLTEDPDRYLLEHLQNRPLHTETDTIDDRLPVTLDAFDTENVGQFVHSVLTTAVERGVSATALQAITDEVEDIIEANLQRHGPPATEAERNGLIEFLAEFVIPEFVTSELWNQLDTAEQIYVEKPLRAHISRNDVEFELDGQADFVTRQPDNTWTITDMKITLTDMNPESRRRYQLQVTAYAALLAAEDGVEGPITQSIEAFGTVTHRINSPWPHSVVKRRLDALLEEGR